MPSVHQGASSPSLSCAGEGSLFTPFCWPKRNIQISYLKIIDVHYGVVPVVSWITTSAFFFLRSHSTMLPFTTVTAHSILSEDEGQSIVAEAHYLSPESICF